MSIRILELTGSPHDMGLAHGRRHRDAIRAFAAERVALSGDPSWSGRRRSRAEVLELADACLEAHRAYAPDLVEELEGMAAATDLGLAELIVVGGFTDFIDTVCNSDRGAPVRAHAGADNCTAFLVPPSHSADGRGLFGQTWDMHASAREHVTLLRGRPLDAPEFLAFTTVGCVGMIGMNEAGVAVGINNLSGGDGRVGVTWPFVVREILRSETLDDACRALERAPLAGAHNYLIMDRSGRGVNVEATSTARHVSELRERPLVHTNHCLADTTRAVERPREPQAQAGSERRLQRARELLDSGDVTPEKLQDLTRDPVAVCVRAAPPRHIETCGAAVMRPESGDFWAVQGLPSENPYHAFRIPA